MDGHNRTVDGQLLKVRSSVTVDLRVEVREQTALQQRVLREVNTTNNMTRLEHDLLNLSEVVDRVGIELQHTERLQRGELLGDDLGRVEDIKVEARSLLLVDDLDVELPLREVARVDGVPQVLTVEVRVLARGVQGLVPDQASLALLSLEVPLDELGLALVGDETVGVHTEAILLGVSRCAS